MKDLVELAVVVGVAVGTVDAREGWEVSLRAARGEGQLRSKGGRVGAKAYFDKELVGVVAFAEEGTLETAVAVCEGEAGGVSVGTEINGL